jgi:hypothetical protein
LPQGIAVAREKDIEQALFMDLQQLPGHYENSCGGSRLEKEWQKKNPGCRVTRRLPKVLFAPDDLSRPLFAPPGVPAERVKVLRDGFMNLMNDRDVLTDARKKGLVQIL